MARLRHLLEGLLALALMLGEFDAPSEQAVDTLFGLAIHPGGVAQIERLSRHLQPSRAAEFHGALRLLSARLEVEGYEIEAYQVLQIWKWGSI